MLIQKLRLQRGWSQQQLADLSGLSVRTIQRLEKGQDASVESLKSLGYAYATLMLLAAFSACFIRDSLPAAFTLFGKLDLA